MRWNSVVGGSDAEFRKNSAYWIAIDKVSGIQIRGDYNITERNIVAGFPIGVHIRNSSEGNLVINNRIKQTEKETYQDGDECNIITNEE